MFRIWKYLALIVKHVFNFHQCLPETTFLQADLRFRNPKLPDVGNIEAVSRQIVPFHDSTDVAILIGNNLPSAIRPREVIAGNDDEPYAQKSILDWGIVGVVGSSKKGDVLVSNRISVSSKSSLPVTTATSKALVKPQDTYSNAKFVFTTETKEIFNPLQVKQMMEIDFIEPGGKNIELSIEDQRFVKKLSDNIQQQDDGHYVVFTFKIKSNCIAK